MRHGVKSILVSAGPVGLSILHTACMTRSLTQCFGVDYYVDIASDLNFNQ